MNVRKYPFQRYFDITNFTNCETGTFHKWELKDKKLACKICNKSYDQLKKIPGIYKDYLNVYLQTLAKNYYKQNTLYKYFGNSESEKDCSVCKKFKQADYALNTEELKQFEKKVYDINSYKIICYIVLYI